MRGPSCASLFAWSPDNLRLLVGGDYADHPTLWDIPGCLACERAHLQHTVDGSEIRRENQLSYVVYPMIYKVLYIPGGCLGFLPSAYHEHLRPILFVDPQKVLLLGLNGSVMNYYAVSTWASFLLKISCSSFCRWNSPLESLGGLRANNMFIFMKGARSIFMKSTGFPVFRQGPQRYQFGIEDFWWSLFS